MKTRTGTIVAAEIQAGTLNDLPFELVAAMQRMEALMAAQDEYFRRRPHLRLARAIGVLPDPYLPARQWALERVGAMLERQS